jgi:hypothetical protein
MNTFVKIIRNGHMAVLRKYSPHPSMPDLQ